MKKIRSALISLAVALLLVLPFSAGPVWAGPEEGLDVSADDPYTGIFDEAGYLSAGETDKLINVFRDLYAKEGVKAAFLTTEHELPSDVNEAMYFSDLSAYFGFTDPGVLMAVSDLENKAMIRMYNITIEDAQVDQLVSEFVQKLDMGTWYDAAYSTALHATEMIHSGFDKNAFKKDAGIKEYHHINDLAHLLSETERDRLEQLFEEKSQEIGVDIIFHTEDYFSDQANAACDHLGELCEKNGYGYGDERYVLMFAISVSNRYAMAYEWSANIEKYHRYLQVELDDIRDALLPNLKTGMDCRSYDPEVSQEEFAGAAEKVMEYAVKHADIDDAPYKAFTPEEGYDRYNLDGKRKILWGRMLLLALAAAAVSGIVTAFVASSNKPKTVTDPDVYSNRKEFAIMEQSDQFRVRTTTRVRISSERSGGGGGFGGGGGGGGGHGSGGHF